ncbi:MAG: DUF1269 domain-containing protein, partial [Syntrophobacteraceae bacterium]
MNSMVISYFADDEKAERARRHLLAMRQDKTLDLEDTLIVKKTGEGEVELRYVKRATLAGAMMGAFWGALVGILFLNPLFAITGLIIGFIIGTVSGSLSPMGVDTELARAEAESMMPGYAALCVLARGKADKILKELEEFNGDILQTKVCT